MGERLGRFFGERVVVGEGAPAERPAVLHGREGDSFAALPPVDARVAAAHALAAAGAVLELNHRREGGDLGRVGDDGKDALAVDGLDGGAAVEAAIPDHDAVGLGDRPEEALLLRAGKLRERNPDRRVGSDDEDNVRSGVRGKAREGIGIDARGAAVVEGGWQPERREGALLGGFPRPFVHLAGGIDPKDDRTMKNYEIVSGSVTWLKHVNSWYTDNKGNKIEQNSETRCSYNLKNGKIT